MALNPITVSQLNDYIARIIRDDPILGRVYVMGQISGVRYYPYGVFFALVDQDSRISCFMGQQEASILKYPLEDGMEVSVTAYVTVRVKRGDYSLQIRSLERERDEGDLAVIFEKRKKKLSQEGIFNPAHKKNIPFFPSKVGIVTSANGAAVRDILKTIRQRNDYADLLLFSVPVQGKGAGLRIAETIDRINREYRDIDVLIVGRGGGSQEDLWEFNDEELARSIYRSAIPIISGVGHEIDFSLCDLAADLRAATPTAAAQAAVPDTGELREQIEDLKDQMLLQLKNAEMYHRMMIENCRRSMKDGLWSRIQKLEGELERGKTALDALNPFRIMKSGYSVLEDQQGQIIRRADDLAVGEKYKIILAEGSARCQITEKERGV